MVAYDSAYLNSWLVQIQSGNSIYAFIEIAAIQISIDDFNYGSEFISVAVIFTVVCVNRAIYVKATSLTGFLNEPNSELFGFFNIIAHINSSADKASLRSGCNEETRRKWTHEIIYDRHEPI